MMLEINGRNRIVQLLRQRPQSRVELAATTGLVKSSLTKITQQLLQEQVIEEVLSPVAVSGSRGRPQQLLQLRRNINFSVCFYVSVEGIISYLIDQTGAIVHRERQYWDLSAAADCWAAQPFVELLAGICARLCARQGIAVSSLKVITVATQGKIAQHTGVIHYSQLFRERHFNLAQLIREQLGIPSRIVNIAYCSSYYLTKNTPSGSSFLAVLLGYGVGVGISIDGQLLLGPDGTAPEISHVTYSADGPKCYCGACGCTETYLTYRALINAIAQVDEAPVPGEDIKAQLAYIHQQATDGNEAYLNVIRQAGQVLGFVVSQLTTVFDLRQIIINGEMSIFFGFFKEEIMTYLQQHSDYSFGDNAIQIACEVDDDIAFSGLVELTNESYLL